jgi:hypothetical protein
MNSEKKTLEQYTQVRRVLARIAIANEEIDEQERIVIASSIGGASNLTGEQLKTLIDDAKKKPDITSLVSEIEVPIFLRQLMVDFSALILMKTDWQDSEVETFKLAVTSMNVSQENQSKLLQAFELLRSVSQAIPTE